MSTAAVTSLLNCTEKGECCELGNVLSSVVALGISITAGLLATMHRADVQECLLGLGQGAASLQDMLVALTLQYTVIITLNSFSVLVLWLSFFHCDFLECSVKHCMTSAKSLGWLFVLTLATFGMQLSRLGYALALHGVLSFLGYVCNLGPGVVYLAQELIYAMGNATFVPGAGVVFSPYGERPYGEHSATSPYLNMDDMVRHFDFLTYCKDTDGGKDAGTSSVMLGCFMTVISQVLMAIALNGEKERVSVHDLHEQHNILEMAKQMGTQATGAFEHMPLLQALQHHADLFGNHRAGLPLPSTAGSPDSRTASRASPGTPGNLASPPQLAGALSMLSSGMNPPLGAGSPPPASATGAAGSLATLGAAGLSAASALGTSAQAAAAPLSTLASASLSRASADPLAHMSRLADSFGKQVGANSTPMSQFGQHSSNLMGSAAAAVAAATPPTLSSAIGSTAPTFGK